jgi:hypothetical protein
LTVGCGTQSKLSLTPLQSWRSVLDGCSVECTGRFKIIAINRFLAQLQGNLWAGAALLWAWLNSVMTRRAMELRIWSTRRSSLLFSGANAALRSLRVTSQRRATREEADNFQRVAGRTSLPNLFFVSACLL